MKDIVIIQVWVKNNVHANKKLHMNLFFIIIASYLDFKSPILIQNLQLILPLWDETLLFIAKVIRDFWLPKALVFKLFFAS